MSEVYGAFNGAIDFLSGLWDSFMGFDSETMLLVGIVIGFAIALVLGFVAQSTRNPDKGSKSEERKLLAGSVGQSQNMCA